MLGDSVTGGGFEDGKLKYITTQNHANVRFEADNFIIATGSFFSKGLVSDINGVKEPIFGLDVKTSEVRADWYKRNLFESQPYMSFGVASDSGFRASREGKSIENLYVAGSVLAGCNSLKEGSGAGVAILSSLHVASLILNR